MFRPIWTIINELSFVQWEMSKNLIIAHIGQKMEVNSYRKLG